MLDNSSGHGPPYHTIKGLLSVGWVELGLKCIISGGCDIYCLLSGVMGVYWVYGKAEITEDIGGFGD